MPAPSRSVDWPYAIATVGASQACNSACLPDDEGGTIWPYTKSHSADSSATGNNTYHSRIADPAMHYHDHPCADRSPTNQPYARSVRKTGLGRPRDTGLDTAIANATETVLLSDGYAAVNIDRVAPLPGKTRAAVYLRANPRGDPPAGRRLGGSGMDPAADTGQLRRDLLRLQKLQRTFFTDPVIQAALAGVLSDLRTDDDLAAT